MRIVDPTPPRLITLMALTLSVTAGAQDASITATPLRRLAFESISAVMDVDAKMPYAFAIERGGSIRVLDIADPANIKRVASLVFDREKQFGVIHGDTYYMGGGQLAMVDISDPMQPRWLGEDPEFGNTQDLHLIGDTLYVTHVQDGVLLDVLALGGQSERPLRLTRLRVGPDPLGATSAAVMAHDQSRLFILLSVRNAGGELVVVDISDPSRATVDRRIALPEAVYYSSVAVRGDIAFLLNWETGADMSFDVLRIDDSPNAQIITSLSDERLSSGCCLAFRDNAVYASMNSRSGVTLATYDISDPANPRVAYTYTPPVENDLRSAGGHSTFLTDDRLYVGGDWGPSQIFDVSTPLAPIFLGNSNVRGGWARDLTLDGDIAIVVDWARGFFTYDIHDPTAPKRIGNYLSEGDGSDHLARFGHDVLLTFGWGSRLVDASDPSAPKTLRGFGIEDTAVAGGLTSRFILHAHSDARLQVFDRSDESREWNVTLDAPAADLEVHGATAVIAHPDGGISRVDLEATEGPELIGRAGGTDTGSTNGRVVTRLTLSDDGSRAFTLRGMPGSQTLVVRAFTLDANGIVQLDGSLELPLTCGLRELSMQSVGDELFIGDGQLIRIDVSNPQQMRVASRHELGMALCPEGIAVRDGIVYVAAGEAGLQIFELPAAALRSD